MRYSVLIGCLMMILFISLNSFQSSSAAFESFTSGSNFGPPGIAMFNALAVKNDFGSKR